MTAPVRHAAQRAARAQLGPEITLVLHCARAASDATRLVLRPPLDAALRWPDVIELAHYHRVLPLVERTLRRLPAGSVPPEVLDMLGQHVQRSGRRALYLAGELLKLLERFEQQGIPAVPFKGPALAATLYDTIALRPFDDLDILVRTEDVARAKLALVAQGHRPLLALTPAQEAAYLRSQYVYSFAHHDGEHIIELHHELRPRYFAFSLAPEQLWQRLSTTTLLGRAVRSLSPEDLLLLLCAHGANHCWERLFWIGDIAALLRATPGLDWPMALARAQAVGSERMVLLGLQLAHELLDAPLPAAISRRAQADPVIDRLIAEVWSRLASVSAPPPPQIARARFHLRARERWRDRARYCARLVLQPTEDDWARRPLPQRLTFLYRLYRPLALLRRYALPTLLSRRGDRTSSL